MKKNIKNKIIKNKKGQMAIFIAIIFQVLFVLFAMSINVALVVHDKVNLQNSVDLAAYYGAQKQAELLNVIAHQNYQIRQAWKLLAWRYRTLGQFGVGSDVKQSPVHHPARRLAQNRNSNNSIFSPNVGAPGVNKETPVICVGYNPIWKPNTGSDKFCQTRTFKVPDVAVNNNVVSVFTRIGQINANQNTENLLKSLSISCSNMVAYNYGYATSILYSFRYEQKSRKEIIYGLINQMRRNSKDFIDLNGDSVSAGVSKMVEKNLTFNNQEGDLEVIYYNSLGNKDTNFFSPIDVNPRMLYTDTKDPAYCKLNDDASKFVSQYPSGLAKEKFQKIYEAWQVLYDNAQESISPNNVFQYSLGIEKNPWNWVYSAVVAKTTTRPIFFPIGDRLTIKARAFAKPFGGRIGPWHKENWARGDKISKGGARVDLLVPPRLDENGQEQSLAVLRKDPTIFPNHSRYPGDKFGLRSHLALNAIENLRNTRLSVFTHYNTLFSMGSDGHDSLAPKDKSPILREYEVGAIAPDLFDSTYYSIEPEFSKVYMEKLKANKVALMSGGPYVSDVSKVKILGDLGSEPQKPMDVFEQVQISKKVKNPQTFYYIKEPVHLLTGWLHGFKALDFATIASSDSNEWFANCDKGSNASVNYGKDESKIPGGCLKNGGRTGYSVKLFSGKLFNSSLSLGGNGVSPGRVLNPPIGAIWN